MEPTQVDPSLRPVVEDVAADVQLALKAVKAYKVGGKAALLDLLPEATALVHREIADVQAALPVIKGGFKTSEFWLGVGVAAGVVTTSALGHPLPVSDTVILGAVTAIYTIVRGLVKKTPPVA